jgi:hypothetical protein
VRDDRAKLIPLKAEHGKIHGAMACIVKPEDIELEGNNAVLTIKALAVLIVPNESTRYITMTALPDTSDEIVEKGDCIFENDKDKEKKEKWRSPLDDPDCPFALESDEHPK